MQQTMQWATLYSAKRSGDARDKVDNPDRLRTSFLRDYDRIIFSSAFRRLQNKTQVFPLPGPVFVHNRLTHSLEVASVGRSLGREVGVKIADKYKDAGTAFQEFYRYELATVISAACLSHDIGNPPFGHSGEDAIRAYFSDLEGEQLKILEDNLSANQLQDFRKFEGNSNAFRILTHSFNEPISGGYNLTHTTLASIVKYPCTSVEGFNKKTGLISCKKSGFFDSEIATYTAIAENLGLLKKGGYDYVYARHPYVYLTEAADDICYRIIDLEDAHRLGITSLEKIQELFLPFFKEESGYNNYETVTRKLQEINDPNQKVQYIRAIWIGLMVNKLTALFMEHETAILAGNLQESLMDLLPPAYLDLLEAVNQYSYKHVYNYKPVVQIEIAGFHIIGALLKEFNGAVLRPDKAKSGKLLKLISQQFPIKKGAEHLYENLQSVVDYISGMTDLYAIDLYRKITGINVTGL
ncbi:dGTP triphosphohydrolase [Taibaiella chishuiensis]|uniref:dGTPase n=1 Tax=Taibaiella chishuiensis TaxID=1434707 RepID=A0A2P8DB02_9BACT|nr:dNTP triphosphohydrolase [Taibaiella chishuiensis]PSK94389.1 dGTPase [Taibaiella chishuiensis]